MSCISQSPQREIVALNAFTLPAHCAINLEAIYGKLAQNFNFGSLRTARRIDILNAQQPSTVCRSGVGVTGDSGHQ